ncbi:MAG TPA: GAF domain-containing protein, partial [Vicinamibacterales bacterium]|nr:GAF domain-containing protein [Vicinamibacterales bacterium]
MIDTVAENAARICGATDATIRLLEGDSLRLVARFGSIPLGAPDVIPCSREYPSGRSVIECRTIHIEDILPLLETEFPPIGTDQRTVLATPLMREGLPIGVILIRRVEAQPFTDKQIKMLETFADQAVIAIENARLFTELGARNRDLTTALDQQTATSEILRVISSSTSDVQPVFDAIARTSMQLCEGAFSIVLRYDGDLMHLGAAAHVTTEGAQLLRRDLPHLPGRDSISGRAILEGTVVQVTDAQADPSYSSVYQRAHQARSGLAVPMLRDGRPVGAIAVGRHEVRPFTDQQAALLKTFADQAVIAIENVRLFTELQTSNRELTTALDKQTATSDILRVISRSQTDVQPVFDAIVTSAVRLLRAHRGGIFRIAGDQLELAALTSSDDAADAALRAAFPRSLHSEGPIFWAIRDRGPINIADAQTDPRVPEAVRASARARGYRSLVGVPLLRQDEAIGAISVSRRESGGFTDDESALLQSFADQAVIAIENVRLFKELEARNRDLTATSEILRVISRSPTDVQPVFDAIVESAARLCNGVFSSLHTFDGELMHLVAGHNWT